MRGAGVGSRHVRGAARPRILFICRGSAEDGLGHVMRSRTIAAEMPSDAAVRLVVIGDAYVEGLLAGRGVRYEIVPDEAAAMATFKATHPDAVVFDLMHFGAAKFDRIAQSCPTVSVSPVFDRLKDVDHFFHRTRELGEMFDGASFRGRMHAGLDFAVIRPGCRRINEAEYERHLYGQPLSVALSMGGADAGNKTLRVLRKIAEIDRSMLFWVLLGEGYGHSYEALVDCVKASSRHEIILAKTSDSIWRVMHGCALALLGGGLITYEAAFAGLPSINLFEQADQQFLVKELVECGAALCAGSPLDAAIENAARAIRRFDGARQELLAMHRRCRDLIDGQGARRIAGRIVRIAHSGVRPLSAARCEVGVP